MEIQGSKSAGGQLARVIVEKKEGNEACPIRTDRPRVGGEIVLEVPIHYMRENGGEKDKIKFAVSKWEPIFCWIEASIRVVHSALNIGELESKIGVFRAYMALAPTYPPRDDVNSFITPFLQVCCQWSLHSPDSATDLQYPVLAFQSSQIGEILQELISCGFKITISCKIEIPRWQQFLATPQ